MYIGNDLQIAHPSYKIIDDISSGFNGSTTSFALQVSGATPVPFPISTQQVMISVNGVVQEPDPNGGAGFKLLGSNIVFSSAPANGHAFFGVINAGADYVTAGSEFPDGSATAPSFTFQDDQDTGWFRNASGDVGYSSNGAAILNFDGNGLTIASGKGLTVDTNTLHVDATNNRVGIGKTNPAVALDVAGEISLPFNNTFRWTQADGTVSVDMYANSGDSLIIRNDSGTTSALLTKTGDLTLTGGLTVDTNTLHVDATNNRVGIGTASPTKQVEIRATGPQISLVSDANGISELQFGDAADTVRGNILYRSGSAGEALCFNTYNNTEAMRLDQYERLLVGLTSSYDVYSSSKVHIASTTGEAALSISRWSNNSSSPYLNIGKSRGAIGTPTIVQDDDRLGQINFVGADGTDLATPAASIAGFVDGTPGSNDMPGRLVFSTTADNAATETERMRIDSSGKVGIGDTAPDALLSIKGDSNEASNPSIRLKDGTDAREAWITNNSGDLMLANGGNDNVYHSRIRLMDGKQINFDIDGSNALNIDSSRNATFAGQVKVSASNATTVALSCGDSGTGFYNSGTNAIGYSVNGTQKWNIDSSGNLVVSGGTVSDSKGDLRSIPRNNLTSTYTLVAADAGKFLRTTAGVTVPAGVLTLVMLLLFGTIAVQI
jgi:hypothetical protein